MCGIIGLIYRDVVPYPKLSSDILGAISHRGPDDSGTFINDHIEFGHTRLSILDLSSAGHQPMLGGGGRYVLTYNGEIYNFIELRAELVKQGYEFVGNSDSEVLLASYQAWGGECVHRFRGMFAFVIWDNHEKTAFMARDRTGEKPLFYYRNSQSIIFASELKGLLPLLDSRPKLNKSAVDLYFHYQFVPEPLTPLEGILKLPAGHTLLVGLDNWDAKPARYWSIEDCHRQGVDNSSNPEELVLNALEESVKLSLRSDVPVGIALSGGIDSGIIAALAQRHYSGQMHAFCVGYPGRPTYDERDNAILLANRLGIKVHEVELPVNNFVDFFPELVRLMDEPIADRAAFGHYSIPRAAADAGIKVLLSGIGGDELFWGYPWVSKVAALNQDIAPYSILLKVASYFKFSGTNSFLEKIIGKTTLPHTVRNFAKRALDINLLSLSKGQLLFYLAEPEYRNAFEIKQMIYAPDVNGMKLDQPSWLENIGGRRYDEVPAAIMQMHFNTWLVSNCVGLSDRVSMSVGVETRLPFLDVKLIELVMKLRYTKPDHRDGHKTLLRNACKNILPDEVLNRPKSGFQPPIHEWLSGVVDKYGEIIRNGELQNVGILDGKKIDFILENLSKGNGQELFFAYKIILFEMWYQEVVAPVFYQGKC